MYNASDLRKGLKVEIEGQPYSITEFSFVKPGKGQAIYTCRMKNMISGATLVRNFRSHDTVGKPDLTTRTLRYSYHDGQDYVFLDDSFEQAHLREEALGDNRFFLAEEMEIEVLYFEGRPIDVTLPTFIEKVIADTEPGARGDTATNVLKAAKIEGGYEIQVPLFINVGDLVRIDTRTGAYADRVSKR